MVCRYHYFRGTCCFLHVHTSWQQCCMIACLILQKWKSSCYNNSSKYETIMCICMCPMVLRVFLLGGGWECAAKQVQGLLCIEIKNHQKTYCVNCTLLLLWWFEWDVNASCMIQFCKCELMVVLGTSIKWSMSSVHSMKGLRKWTKLWIILYFLNTTDILQYRM